MSDATMPEATRILVIDDEAAICRAFERYFQRRGATVSVAATGAEGLERFSELAPHVTFLDVRLPDADGLDVLDELRQRDADARVIVITAYGNLETVSRAVRGRAFDYLVKPLDLDRAAELVAQARASEAPRPQRDGPAGAAPGHDRDATTLVGSSPAMQEVYKRIGKVAAADAAVLIRGDTGTGKELVARAIHEHSGRRDRPFVAVNCGALPENLVESELFGYVRGAFSGADADKPGRFEAADTGTLFLDEVAELPPAAQVKLLRFLDSQVVERLGSIRPIRLDVRVLAATNRDVRAAVAGGAFRDDLFYRLAVVEIELPPLARRAGDPRELAEHFLERTRAAGRELHLSEAAAELLARHDWPGNVRELRNAIEHAAVVCGGDVILPAHLPDAVRSATQSGGDAPDALHIAARRYVDVVGLPADGDAHPRAIEPVEREVLRRALAEASGNQSAAAKILGIHRNTLRAKIREYDLDEESEQ